MKRLLLSITAAAVILTEPAVAADIAAETRTGARSPTTQNGGYFELGIVAGFVNDPFVPEEENVKNNHNDGMRLNVIAAGEYRYKGFFIEAAPFTSDGINLGYNLGSGDDWSLDLLAYSGNVIGIGGDEEDSSELTEAERNDELLERLDLFHGAGFRVTGYLGNYVLQLRAVSDYKYDAGTRASVRLGRNWQVRNWNFHSILSAEYASADYNQKRFGITAEEATTRFGEYYPDSSVTFHGEIGVTYPVSENWVFRSTIVYRNLPDTVEGSPLIEEGYASGFLHAISYVF